MSSRLVTVFGATGFLGRWIVRHLHDADFAVRIASRHPDRGCLLFSGDASNIETVRADANDDASVATAVSGSWAVVNAVSLYVERGKLLRHAPVFPLFGRGQTRLQPAYVEDVAEAIVRALKAPARGLEYELAGPRVYTYAELLRTIADAVGRKPVLFPVPFALWRSLGFALEYLPGPPITRNQIDLMQTDNVAAPDAPGFATLGVSPRPLEDILPKIAREV